MIDIASVKTGLVKLVTHSIVFGLAWFYQSDKYGKAELDRLKTDLLVVTANAEATNKSLSAYAETSTKIRTRTVTKLIKVPEIVERVVYKNVCIDEEGLNLINNE